MSPVLSPESCRFQPPFLNYFIGPLGRAAPEVCRCGHNVIYEKCANNVQNHYFQFGKEDKTAENCMPVACCTVVVKSGKILEDYLVAAWNDYLGLGSPMQLPKKCHSHSQGLFYIFNGRKVMKKPFEKIRGYRIEKRMDKRDWQLILITYIASEIILCNRALSGIQIHNLE